MNTYITADCGTGKTHKMVNEIFMTYQNVKHLIVQPTKLLNSKTAERLKPISDSVRVINSDDYSNIVKQIKHALHDDDIRVIIISEVTFYMLEVSVLKDIKIWMDDCVKFYSLSTIGINLQDYEKLSNVYHDSAFTVKGEYNEFYDEVEINVPSEEMSDAVKDTVNKLLKDTSGFNRIAINKDYMNNPPSEKQKRYINVVAWHDLSVYKDLNIVWMSNNFESTLLFKHNIAVMKQIDFRGLAGIDKSRLDVRYFVKSENLKYGLTKAYADSVEGKDALQKVRHYINTNEDSFYFTTNIEGDDAAILSGDSYSPNLRGVDDMKHMKTCAWLSCMNASSHEVRVVKELFGFSSLDLKIEREYEVMYQFACRGVIRERESTENMVVYVVTEDQAMFLVDNPTFIDVGIQTKEVDKGGRPEGKTLSADEQKKWNAYKKKCTRNNDYTTFETFLSEFDESTQEFLKVQWNKLLTKKGV